MEEPTGERSSEHRPAALKNAYALLVGEPEIAVVFVHGFLGNSRSTWIDFQHLIDRKYAKTQLWSKCDLYFYNYRSHDQIQPLAEDLLTFLHDIVLPGGFIGSTVSTRTFDFPSGFRLAPDIEKRGRYKHLVLVGHSTGAVVIRQAVIQELRSLEESGQLALASYGSAEGESLIPASSLRFFAPAHRGVLGAGWLGIALTLPLLSLIASVWLHSNPLYRSLSAGNPVLEDLKTATERLYEKYKSIPALTAHSIFGSGDAVVIMGGYQHDKVHPTVPNRTHTSICKPSVSFTKPLEFVTDAIFSTAAGK